MDITEYVKRNNFAVAQYEAKSRRTAQNRVFSNKATGSPQAPPRVLRSRANLRITVLLPEARITAKPSRRDSACPASTGRGATAATTCLAPQGITHLTIRNIFDGQTPR